MYGIWCNLLVSNIKLFLDDESTKSISENTNSIVNYLVEYGTNFEELYDILTVRGQKLSLKSIQKHKYKSLVVKFSEPPKLIRGTDETDEEFSTRESKHKEDTEIYTSLYSSLKSISEEMDKLSDKKKYGMYKPYIRRNGNGVIVVDLTFRKTPKNYKNGNEKLSYTGLGDVIRKSAEDVFSHIFNNGSTNYVLTGRFKTSKEDQYRIFTDNQFVKFVNGLKQLYIFYQTEMKNVEGIETEPDVDLMTAQGSATDIESDVENLHDDSAFENL